MEYRSKKDSVKFLKGQKLIINKCVVEYLGEQFIPQVNRQVMQVRCSDGTYGIHLDRRLVFQPANTNRPLSSLLKVVGAYHSAEVLDNPIDYILGTKTLGNKAQFETNVMLVSRIGETEHFVRENKINGTNIIDLFLWGKLDVEGNVSIMGPQQIQGNPCCLVSSDLFGAWHYIRDNAQRNKGIIIDSVANCINNLQVMDEILDDRIPVVVVCDLLDTEHLQHLDGRGFKIWQWNKKNVAQIEAITIAHKFSPFYSLNISIFNYCCQKINAEPCHYPQLDTVIKNIIDLGKLISQNEQLNVSYFRLFQLVNDLSRLIRVPEQSWAERFHQKLQLSRQQFNAHQQWLSDRAIQCTSAVIVGLADLAEKRAASDNHKVNRLYELINQAAESDTIGIVVAKTEEAELSQQYWTARLPPKKSRNIRFVTMLDLLGPDSSFLPDQIIICGWLGMEKMFQLLHSHITSRITLLLYPFEAKWFASAQRGWTERTSFNIRAKDFSDMLELTEKDLEAIEYKSEEPVEAAKKDEVDIVEFELKIRQNRYRSYVFSGDSPEEVARAKLVVFAGNRFAYLKESHRLPVVTEVTKEKGSVEGFPRKDVTQLQAGDYVLFQESNRDIIREIADRGLVKAGQPHLRQVAGLWREALRETYQKIPGGLDGLVELLRNAGCMRHPVTIKNWLFDEDQIGPGIIADLQRIAKATRNRSLNNRLDEVSGAILRVRGAHHEASIYIRNKLLASLPEIIVGERSLPNYASGAMLLNLDEFGQVEILQIEEIGDDWEEIPASSVNRLQSEED